MVVKETLFSERTQYLDALLHHRIVLTEREHEQIQQIRLMAAELLPLDGMVVLVTSPDYHTVYALPGADAPIELLTWFCQALDGLEADERLDFLSQTVQAPGDSVQGTEEAAQVQAGSYVRLPVRLQDSLKGVVILYNRQPKLQAPHNLPIAHFIAEMVAVRLENLILQEHYRRSEAYQQVAYKMSLLINDERSLTDILEEVTQESLRLTRASTALVLLVDRLSPSTLRVAAQAGSEIVRLGETIRPADFGERGATSELPRVDLENYSRYENALHRILEQHSIHSSLNVALVSQEDLLGVLIVARLEAEHPAPFTVNEQEILELLAPLAATAIEKGQLRDSVRQERSQLHALLDHIRAPIMVFTSDGKLEMANPEAHNVGRRIGISLYGLIGKSIGRIAKMLPPQTNIPKEFLVNTPIDIDLGEAGEFVIRIAEVPGMEGNPESFVVVGQEMTRERRLDRAKSELLYILSHDLGNILTLGLGYAGLAVDDDLSPEEFRSVMKKVYESLIRARALIRDVVALDHTYGSSSDGRIQQPYRVDELVEEVCRVYIEFTEGKNQHLITQVREKSPILRGNAALIKQAIENLVTNAIKYTPEGGTITVAVSNEADQVVVRVQDTGLGISAEALPHIWERYYRVEEHRRLQIPGTGLGLPLVKSVIESHNGRIEVQSEVGAGSTFIVRLPIEPETLAE